MIINIHNNKAIDQSKPTHKLLILCKPTHPFQQISWSHHESKNSHHFNVRIIGNSCIFQIEIFSKIWKQVSSHDKTKSQGNNQKFKLSSLRQIYLPFFKRLCMWGYPPWLDKKTEDWEIAVNKKMTVFTKDFWNYWSADAFLSSSNTYLSPM